MTRLAATSFRATTDQTTNQTTDQTTNQTTDQTTNPTSTESTTPMRPTHRTSSPTPRLPRKASLALAGLVSLAALTAAPAPAAAHTMGNGYLSLTVSGAKATGQIDLAFRDLHDAVGLDSDLDGQVQWREARSHGLAISRYLTDHLTVATAGHPCGLTFGEPGAVHRADGEHLALPLEVTCAEDITALELDYRAVFEVDAQHRGIVRVARAGDEQQAVVRLIDRPGPIRIELAQPSADVLGFIKQGVWHIWIGVDHICFLLALLLPAVFRRSAAGWEPVPRLADVVRDVLDVVTAFTLAHSITLVISALGWVHLPVRLVETAIAVSVALAALNNLVRAIDARWAVAFALGLLHGFGFSNVLLDVGLPGHHLVSALLGFNLGVELGQLAIVLVFLPVAFAARRTTGYRVLLFTTSTAMALVALRWSLERALT
ncbi:MAG TPA: HupE/UreJ family protein [Kofleriaceae bacterium]|nr:HupE/UreJ family protein [Kofleriaceae bacterium]